MSLKNGHSTSLGGPLVEINITPLTDVILVLLIIFMVATPLLFQSDVKIILPRMSQTSEPSEMPSRLKISVDNTGRAVFEGRDFLVRQDGKSLQSALSAILAGKKHDILLVINADKDCKYDDIMRTIDAAKSSGIKRISLGVQKK